MKLYVEPITITLGILFLASMISSEFKTREDRRDLKQAIDKNYQQATTIATLSSNVVQKVSEVDVLQRKLNETDEQYQKRLDEKDKQTGQQFGIVATQADTIYQSTPNSQTEQHLNTAIGFMGLYGGNMIDKGLAWNASYIANQNEQMKLLKEELDYLKKEKKELKGELEKTTTELKTESNKTYAEALAHKETAARVVAIEGEKAKANALWERTKRILNIVVVISIIGGLLYLAFHIWQILSYRKQLRGVAMRAEEEAARRREANQKRYELENQANELKNAAKIFMSTDKTGNSEFKRILRSNGLKKHFEDFKDVEGKTIDED